jgi:hypothetical protein
MIYVLILIILIIFIYHLYHLLFPQKNHNSFFPIKSSICHQIIISIISKSNYHLIKMNFKSYSNFLTLISALIIFLSKYFQTKIFNSPINHRKILYHYFYFIISNEIINQKITYLFFIQIIHLFKLIIHLFKLSIFSVHSKSKKINLSNPLLKDCINPLYLYP